MEKIGPCNGSGSDGGMHIVLSDFKPFIYGLFCPYIHLISLNALFDLLLQNLYYFACSNPQVFFCVSFLYKNKEHRQIYGFYLAKFDFFLHVCIFFLPMVSGT